MGEDAEPRLNLGLVRRKNVYFQLSSPFPPPNSLLLGIWGRQGGGQSCAFAINIFHIENCCLDTSYQAIIPKLKYNQITWRIYANNLVWTFLLSAL